MKNEKISHGKREKPAGKKAINILDWKLLKNFTLLFFQNIREDAQVSETLSIVAVAEQTIGNGHPVNWWDSWLDPLN